MTVPLRTEPTPTDDDLLARWREGDGRAATALVERHADALARFAATLGMGDDAEDVVQDTFVRAFQSLDGFRGESSLRTWLFSIARRLVVDRRRARRRRPLAVEIDEADATAPDDPLGGLIADETERRLADAIGRLSPTQREVFVLRVRDGLSYKEIAAVADTTEGAARVHYHNAMRSVKEYLDD
ncbi:MAG TPA: sigma-70 family RNA polymerase sigma factor [Gemmatimonadaceae bacterium]|nr:sigma-70 family RNA polymerase sigma factor [Gemmatimonadaceae bacterium]